MSANSWVTTCLNNIYTTGFSNLFEANLTIPKDFIHYEIGSTTHSGISFSTSQNQIPNQGSPIENLQFFIEGISFIGEDGFSLDYGNSMKVMSLSKMNKIDKVSLSIREFSNYKICYFFQKWIDDIYDFENNCFRAYDFLPLGELEVKFFNPAAEEAPFSLKMKDIFPISVTYPSFSWKEGSEPITIKCELSVNDFDWGFSSPSSPRSSSGEGVAKEEDSRG